MRKVADVFLSSRGSDAAERLFVGCTKNMQNLVELIHVISAFEERTSSEEFSEDASDRPNIDLFLLASSSVAAARMLTGFCVALEAQHDFRSTVPSRRNIFGHVSSIFLGVNRESSGQPKITNFQLAVGID